MPAPAPTPAPVRVRPPLFLRLAPLIRHLIRENERTPSPPITPFNRSWNIQSETRACRNEGKLRVRVHGPPVQAGVNEEEDLTLPRLDMHFRRQLGKKTGSPF